MIHTTSPCSQAGSAAKKARTTSSQVAAALQPPAHGGLLSAEALSKTVYGMGDARLAAVLSGLLTEQVAALPADAPGWGWSAHSPPPRTPLLHVLCNLQAAFSALRLPCPSGTLHRLLSCRLRGRPCLPDPPLGFLPGVGVE
eukprot:TRINITY_DN381_c0_g1_i7.p2 TRINITY_DN381_c0_g1~~TRINITY_DN381_c0_g1_i7.p2  ORF type:complete len:142 (-),score=1.57 TRINITY_DN381_c0_g1_i7:561-986(-)